MQLITFIFLLIGVSSVTPQIQLPGVGRVIVALTNYYESLENVAGAVNGCARSMDRNEKCSGPNKGGLHEIAISIDAVAKQTQILNTSFNKVVDSSGNLNGNLNPPVNNINKLAKVMNSLAKSFRSAARNGDYFSGDFKGLQNALKDWGKSFENFTTSLERLRGLSEVFMNTVVNATQIKKGLRDTRSSIIALRQSFIRKLKRCGQTNASVKNVIKALAYLQQQSANAAKNI